MKALIDADVLRYRIGFACEDHFYHVLVEGEEHLGPVNTFTTKTETEKWINGEEGYKIEKEVVPAPIEHCLHSVKLQIQEILQATQAEDYQLYLTGKGNFREKAATIKPYKGNRDPLHKPFHYKAITEYLIEYWDAIVIDGMEVDDAMGIAQWENQQKCIKHDDVLYGDTIICTIDKDLNMIPGWHYNFAKKEKYWVSEEEAIRFFYTQLLMGDPTDNIQGIPGVGPIKAKKIIGPCKTEEEMFDAVVDEYWSYCLDNGSINPNSEAWDMLQENAKLLWIKRTNDDEWKPPASV